MLTIYYLTTKFLRLYSSFFRLCRQKMQPPLYTLSVIYVHKQAWVRQRVCPPGLARRAVSPLPKPKQRCLYDSAESSTVIHVVPTKQPQLLKTPASRLYFWAVLVIIRETKYRTKKLPCCTIKRIQWLIGTIKYNCYHSKSIYVSMAIIDCLFIFNCDPRMSKFLL